MEYQREHAADVMDEIKPLLQKHWHEIAHFPDVPLDPDYDAYLRAEQAGKLRVFTARSGLALVGYGVFFIGNLHYKSTPIATQDILFLSPEHRGIAGVRLIRFCDRMLKADGIRKVYHHVKPAKVDFSRVLRHEGYELVDHVWARSL